MSATEAVLGRGWKIGYVPASLVGKHVACYNVEYAGVRFRPRAAVRLGIPLNEIWISEDFEDNEDGILAHEIREIELRTKGLGERRAHKIARNYDTRNRAS